jgi:hypothetical protein
MGTARRARKSIPLSASDPWSETKPAPRIVLGSTPSDMADHLRRLDFVIHDFPACVDPVSLTARVDGPRRAHAESLRRILETELPANGVRLGPPVLCGTSPPIGLEGVLGFLGSLRKTGVLRVRADGATYMISVVRGDVANGVSQPRPEGELLGNILLRRGRIDADRLGRFFAECGPSAFRIVESLERQELVGTADLREALEIQLQHLFDRLLAARSAEWCFHDGEAMLSLINLRVNATRVLLESARKRDEAGTA